MRAVATQIGAALWIGLFLRYWRGFSMLDPFFLIPFACLSAILAGPTLLDLARKKPTQPTLRRVIEASARASGSVLLMLAIAVVSLNYPWHDKWLLPEGSTAVEALLLSIASAFAAAALTSLACARLSPRYVKWIFRGLALAVLIVWRELPADLSNKAIIATMEWGMATTMIGIALALLTVDAGLFYLLSRRPSAQS